jgi:capsule polysaccharide export protein KpsE/RkpR
MMERIEQPTDQAVSDSNSEARDILVVSPNWIVNVSLLLRHRRLLTKVVGVALLVNLAIALLIPKQFQSLTRIMPPESSGSGTALIAALAGRALGGETLGGFAASLLGDHNSGALFMDLLRSDTVTGHIVDQFQLQSVYHKRYRVDARKALVRRTRIEQDKKSGVITIVVTDSSPQRARDIAQAYLSELNLLVSLTNTSSAHRERLFVESRLVTVRKELDRAQEALSNFSSTQMTVDVREQTRATVDAAAKLEGELVMTQGELSSLQQIYGDDNVRVRAAEARASNLRKELAKVGGTSAPLSQSSQDDSNANMRGGASQILPFPSLRQLPRLAVPYANLYRSVRIQETVLDLLTQQFEIAQIQEAKDIPVLSVIDSPQIPEKKSFPARTLLILLLTLGELLFISAIIILRHHWQTIDRGDPRRMIARETSDAFRQALRGLFAYRRRSA